MFILKVKIPKKGIPITEEVSWIQNQPAMHKLHDIIFYEGSFAPQIPAYFIEHYSKKDDIILDPFCGRGTTILEANLRNRVGIGADISPLAVQISKTKLKKIKLENVKERLNNIDFSKEHSEGFKKFRQFFHPKTYSQLLNFKNQLTDSAVDDFIKTIIVGYLHDYQNFWHDIDFKDEDLVFYVTNKAITVLEKPIIEKSTSCIYETFSTDLPLKKNSVDLIVTSPPFLTRKSYMDAEWLKFWFLGYEKRDFKKLRKVLVQTGSMGNYKNFLLESMFEMNRVLKPDKYCIIVAGSVLYRFNKINTDQLFVELSEKANFEVQKIIINYITRERPLYPNRCVIMKNKK